MRSGIFGEMMLTYFTGRGGAGVVIDGCIRDYPHGKGLDLGLWIRGVTPNFHTQTDLMPFAARDFARAVASLGPRDGRAERRDRFRGKLAQEIGAEMLEMLGHQLGDHRVHFIALHGRLH